MSKEKSEEEKGFVVKDRRIFSDESSDVKEEEKKAAPSTDQDSAKQPEESDSTEGSQQDTPLPAINFPMFVISLNSSVLVQLGLLEDPSVGRKSKNLPLAKQTIDILGMLEEKTRGNLTKDEENLLKNVLYDLRLLYVKEKGL